MKYKITPYIQDIINKLENGYKLVYYTKTHPPFTRIFKGHVNISVSNWALEVLYQNGIIKPVKSKFYLGHTTYRLSKTPILRKVQRFLGKSLGKMKNIYKKSTKNEFEYTPDGYQKAKEYLESIGKLNEFTQNNTSVDGYSLVHYANSLKNTTN